MKFLNFPQFLMMTPSGDGGGGTGSGSGVADTGGGEGGGGGGGESSALATVESGTDGQVHDAEFVEEGAQPQTQLTRSDRLVENGKITQKAGRAVLDSIRSTHPNFVQPITQALILQDRMRRELPGGFAELAKLRGRIEELGGDTGLTSIRQNSDRLSQLNDHYLRADPAFITEITTNEDPAAAEESQQAFVNLMPHMMARWAQLDSPGRAWFTADQFARGLDQVRMPVLVARVVDVLKANQATLPPGMAESFDAIVEALNTISYGAQANKPALPVKDPKLENERKQLQQERQKITREAWQSSLGTVRKDIFNSTLASLLGTRQLTALERQEVKGYYDMWIRPKAIEREKGIERYLANSDKEGYLKTEGNFYRTEIPKALRNAVAKLAPAGAKPKVQQQSARRTIQPQAPPQAGAVRVATMPNNLDPTRTTAEMLRSNTGIGRDGKKYQWAK